MTHYEKLHDSFYFLFNLESEKIENLSPKLRGYNNLLTELERIIPTDIVYNIEHLLHNIDCLAYVICPHVADYEGKMIRFIINNKDEPSNLSYLQQYMSEPAEKIKHRDSLIQESCIENKFIIDTISYTDIKQNGFHSCTKSINSRWEYSHNGTYTFYKNYRDNPLFITIMTIISLIGVEKTKEIIRYVLLYIAIYNERNRIDDYLKLVSINTSSSSTILFKVDCLKLQKIYDFLFLDGVIDCNFNEFANSIIKCNLSNLMSNRPKIKNKFLFSISKIKDAITEKKESSMWYNGACKTIGITPSECTRNKQGLGMWVDEFENSIL